MKNHRIKRNVELLPFLESVTARVVRHYRQDFEYDRAKLRDAVSEHDMELLTKYRNSDHGYAIIKKKG